MDVSAFPEGVDEARLRAFSEEVWQQGLLHRRDNLPWRFLDDAYLVYVSEVMLQQTQVARVKKRWPEFVAVFPSLDALSSASVSDVLEMWQGMGYNRRALALKRTADECSSRYGGHMPHTYEELLALPGIGPATAAGIMAFAYKQPSVYIETNVRTVFIREFFPNEQRVHDRQLKPLVEATCSQDDPRGWYYALLDWGAYLKGVGVNPNRQSAHYTRQSSFEGSRRQKRAFVLREVLAQPGVSMQQVKEALDVAEVAAGRREVSQNLFCEIVDDLVCEGFFRRDGEILLTDGIAAKNFNIAQL
ncbi:MAG: adenine glycosylase [Eggerthellaceae bacterium]|nr:adenine glycosylase [Eggerthellaceae bacterium]